MKINPTKSAGEVQPLVASFEPRVECGNGNNAELFYNQTMSVAVRYLIKL